MKSGLHTSSKKSPQVGNPTGTGGARSGATEITISILTAHNPKNGENIIYNSMDMLLKF